MPAQAPSGPHTRLLRFFASRAHLFMLDPAHQYSICLQTNRPVNDMGGNLPPEEHLLLDDNKYVADVLYDRANLPLLDQFLSRGKQALVADSRVRDFHHPAYQRLGILEALTLPDLAEPWEFRKVSLYHAIR